MERKRSNELIDVSVVIVSYNGYKKLSSCLKSLFEFGKLGRATIEVFVSDNGSSDDSVEMVRKRFPSVRIIENNANLGFAAANNRALVKCSGRYIFLLNPDTILIEDSISKMVWFMDGSPQVGICGPRLLNGDRSLQFSARNFPSVINQLAESFAVQKIFRNSRKLGELIMEPSFYFDTGKSAGGSGLAPVAPRHVDWVTGATLMIRRETFNDIGLLDERFFMYSEEKDWCYRARLKDWPVVFYPGTEIVHLHGDSSTNPKLFSMMMKSKKLFITKNYRFVRARLIIAIMFLNLAVRFAGFYTAWMIAKMIPKSCSGGHQGDAASSSLSKRLSVIRAGLIGS
jgi:GT2 family glycosyltransferase